MDLTPIAPTAGATQRMGLEVEMLGFDAQTYAPLGLPEARLSPQSLLTRMHELSPGSHLKVDSPTGVVVGLELAGGNFSLEPGGQVEYATSPHATLSELLEDLVGGLRLLEEAAAGQAVFLDHGTNPVADAELPLLVPKHRYQILTRYFASQPGGRGIDMMRYSATSQPNLDIPDGWADAVRLTLALTPAARALFANSRYFHGRRTGPGSERQRIWAAIDASRTGIPPIARAPDLAQAYAEWAENAYVFLVGDLPLEEQPLYGELRFKDWASEGYRGTHPGGADWETHLATLFPDLRLRRFLEIRMVDAQTYEHALAPMAFWATVLQQAEHRERVWRHVQDEPIKLLDLAAELAQDDLASKSLRAYLRWVEAREQLDYPAAGLDFVKATATRSPASQLLSVVGV